jgi:hypothetical protein
MTSRGSQNLASFGQLSLSYHGYVANRPDGALHEVRIEQLFIVLRRLIEARNPSWQTWLHEIGHAAGRYYNGNRQVAEVILGPTSHRISSQATIHENQNTAEIGRFLSSWRFLIWPRRNRN